MNWRDDIAVDPEICHGSTGTRVLVSTILDKTVHGPDSDAIMKIRYA